MVEVLRHYSNSYGIALRVRKLAAHLKEHPDGDSPIAPPSRSAHRRHKVSQRLSGEVVRQIITGYQRGTTAQALAEQHGLARSSITRLLHERGVAVRRQSPTADDVERIMQLHARGLPGRAIAKRTGFSDSTVSRVVRRRPR